VPFLSICSAYDQASWLTIICALTLGELLNTPLEKRWRRQYLEGIGAAAGGQRNSQRRESESVPLPADSRSSSFDGLLEASKPSSVFFAVAPVAVGGLAAGMLFGANSRMLALFGGTLFCGTIYMLLEVDLSIVKRIQLKRLWWAAAEALKISSKETESAIASFMFHELRNDQNAISGFLAILTDELGTGGSVLSPAHQGLLKDARLHAHHASQVITNMLELSKLRANKLTLPAETFEVEELCGECAALVKHLLSGTPVDLRIEVEPELPPVRGSPFHIKQVLLNLLTNACKYTERGSIVLRVEHRGKAKPAAEMVDEAVTARLHFAVMDTGSGVEPERQRLIFTPYTKGPCVGTGLGLPLSRALVKLMGGDLVLTSMMGAGSTFAFEVTLRAAPRSAPPQSAHAKTADTLATASALVPTALRVLIADDMKMNRIVLKHAVAKALPSTALHVSECESGEAALELLSATPGNFDVVFLDEHYGVDSMSGTDVTQAYRAIEQEPRYGVTKPALIIGCSADVGSGAFDEMSRSAGQNASVGKPLLEDLLRSTLLGLLAPR
jgi:signal transduction histidine kinase